MEPAEFAAEVRRHKGHLFLLAEDGHGSPREWPCSVEGVEFGRLTLQVGLGLRKLEPGEQIVVAIPTEEAFYRAHGDVVRSERNQVLMRVAHCGKIDNRLLESVANRKGQLIIPAAENGRALSLRAVTHRLDRGRYLVRVDEHPAALRAGVELEIELFEDQHTQRIYGVVGRVSPSQDGGAFFYLHVCAIVTVNRRREARYRTNLYTTLIPLTDEEPLAEDEHVQETEGGETAEGGGPAARPAGRGRPARIVDLSAGGAQVVTYSPLEPGTRCRLEIRTPSGLLVVDGHVVTELDRPRAKSAADGETGGPIYAGKDFRYGVKFDELDPMAERRLNQEVLRITRQGRLAEAASAEGEGRRRPERWWRG